MNETSENRTIYEAIRSFLFVGVVIFVGSLIGYGLGVATALLFGF